MADPFYWGWGIRNKIFGVAKRSVSSVLRTSEQRAILEREELIAKQLSEYGLDKADSLEWLSEAILISALEKLDMDETAIELPFLQHIARCIRRGLKAEDLFSLPSDHSYEGTRSTQWEIEDALDELQRKLDQFEDMMDRYAYMIANIIRPMISTAPMLVEPQWEPSDLSFSVLMPMVINDLPQLIETMVQMPLTVELHQEDRTTVKTGGKILDHLLVASGGVAGDLDTMPRNPRFPKNSPLAASPHKLIDAYLGGTYLADMFDYSVPIAIPQATRFEHQHIVAGTGHGKTQTLQHLILRDLKAVENGGASIVVLDSQGDLIDKIKGLAQFAPSGSLSGKLVVIDPTDIEYPVALNLFDVGMERINQYSDLERERSINSVLELYDFVLGSLLDAGMTQKQSVLFRYITRLMLHIPDATIATFKELLSEGGSDLYREQIEKLHGSPRDFFETEFDSKEFVQTKRQVLRRLWGILENQTFERMFLHPQSKLDIYAEMNAGKVILINTAKDLLKEQGTEFFGRFFIAMIAQAAQERSVIPEAERLPTFVYIDEAADYFDRNIGIILSQARKYKVGMILAHQYLGQLDNKLQEGVFSNTSIKFAGGVSNKDAKALAAEMRTDAAHIEAMDKLEMAAFIRGTTKNAVSIKIPYGQMEKMPKMSAADAKLIQDDRRNRYAVHYSEITPGTGTEESTNNNPASGDTNDIQSNADENGQRSRTDGSVKDENYTSDSKKHSPSSNTSKPDDDAHRSKKDPKSRNGKNGDQDDDPTAPKPWTD